MATNPIIQRRSDPRTDINLGRVQAPIIDNPLGRTLQGVGRDIQASAAYNDQQMEREARRAEIEGNRAQNALEAQDRKDAQAWLAGATGDAQMKLTARAYELQEQADPSGTGYTPGVMKEFEGFVSKMRENAPTPTAKQFVQAWADDNRPHYFGNAMKWEAGKKQAYNAGQYDQGIEGSVRAVTADPTLYEQERSRNLALINRSELPQEKRSALMERVETGLAWAVGQRQVEANPQAFVQAMGWPDGKADPEKLKAYPWAMRVKSDKLDDLTRHAASLTAQQEARARVGAEKFTREAEKEIDTLRDFAMSGAAPDLSYSQTVLAKVQGTQYEAPARELLRQAAMGQSFGAMPIPQQAELLRQRETQATSPEAAKLLNQARTIHERQARDYKENPWNAAERYARTPAVPDADIQSADQLPQIVAERRALMGEVEIVAGQPVSPFKPQEVAKVTEKLMALPVPQRAEIVAQIGDQLDVPRIAALSEQLDKGNKPLALALKAGADRTTAGRAVGDLILRGAQGLADKTIKKDDEALTGWRSRIAEIVRGSVGDPVIENDIIDAAYYVRAAMDAEGSAVPGFTLKNSEAEAVRLVQGDMIERDGRKAFLPRGWDERRFDERLKTYTPERLRELAPSGVLYLRNRPVKVEAVASGITQYGVRKDSQGRFALSRGNAFLTLDEAGTQPLSLEIR